MLPFTKHDPKVALVTGAGRGLGRELVLRLVEKGLTVGALGRKASDLETLAKAAPEGRVVPLVADVADADSLARAFDDLDRQAGPVDTLINNAAVYPHRDILDETPDSFMATVAINLGGVFTCSKLALDRMVPKGTGRIVNVATFAGDKPTQLAAGYSVSKGAARILTKSLIADLGDRFPDIVINDWIPGALKTEMGLTNGIDPAKAAEWGAALALWHDPALTGALFVQDAEELPPQSLKRRLFNRVSGQSAKPRHLVF